MLKSRDAAPRIRFTVAPRRNSSLKTLFKTGFRLAMPPLLAHVLVAKAVAETDGGLPLLGSGGCRTGRCRPGIAPLTNGTSPNTFLSYGGSRAGVVLGAPNPRMSTAAERHRARALWRS